MKALKFLVYSNIWISLGAFLLTLLSFKINGAAPNFEYCFFMFFSTLFSYNFQRVSRLKKITLLSPNSWVVQHAKIANGLLIISFLGTLIFIPVFFNPFTLFWLIILGVISFGYSYGKYRDLPYIKILLISISWAIASGVIPILFIEDQPTYIFLYSFGWIFFYILAITIPFDIRDIGIDEDSKKTIPQWVGILRAKKIGYLSLCISFVFLLFISSVLGLIAIFFSYIIAAYLIANSTENKNDLYFSFLIDGHIIVQFLFVYFLC